jgi:large subunit ribosomal protein L25
VAGERVKLVVQERGVLGSAESRRLRKRGLIPGVLYGREKPVAIAIPERALRGALTGVGGANAVLDVVVGDDGGRAHASVLKEYQQDPVRGTIVHVDLQEVRLDRPIHATVPVHLVGEAAGTKEGGVLTHVTTEVNVEALPMEVPESLEYDVSELHIGESARLSDVPVPEGVTMLDDPEETVIASVAQPTRVEEPEEVLEEGEAPEGAAEAERPEGGAESAGEPGAAAAGGEGTVSG